MGEGKVGTGEDQLGDDAPLLLLLSSSESTQYLCGVRLHVTSRLFLILAGGGVLATGEESAGDVPPSLPLLLLASLQPHCLRWMWLLVTS